MPIFHRKQKQVEGAVPGQRQRPWAVTAAGLLLLLQGILAILMTIFLAFPHDLPERLKGAPAGANLFSALIGPLVYGLLGAICILASIDFLRMTHTAWSNAIAIQGIFLVSTRFQYFGSKPFYIYFIMLYSIFMVVYLQYHSVQKPFVVKPASQVEEEALTQEVIGE